jgi:hypothetical protein
LLTAWGTLEGGATKALSGEGRAPSWAALSKAAIISSTLRHRSPLSLVKAFKTTLSTVSGMVGANWEGRGGGEKIWSRTIA